MSKVNYGVKEKAFFVDVDTNEDGEKVVGLKLHLSEALQEAFKRGGELEGAKVVSAKFEGASLMLVVDTDKDGEPLLELELSVLEGLDEVQDAVSKD